MDEFTFKDHIQTLTNKTLTNPTINSAALSGTLSGTPFFEHLHFLVLEHIQH